MSAAHGPFVAKVTTAFLLGASYKTLTLGAAMVVSGLFTDLVMLLLLLLCGESSKTECFSLPGSWVLLLSYTSFKNLLQTWINLLSHILRLLNNTI